MIARMYYVPKEGTNEDERDEEVYANSISNYHGRDGFLVAVRDELPIRVVPCAQSLTRFLIDAGELAAL